MSCGLGGNFCGVLGCDAREQQVNHVSLTSKEIRALSSKLACQSPKDYTHFWNERARSFVGTCVVSLYIYLSGYGFATFVCHT